MSKLVVIVRESTENCFSALAIELRFGVTYRDYYEQRITAAALARHGTLDIALIKMKSSVRITSYVKPAFLPRASHLNEMYADKISTVCGMGIENQQTNAVSYYLKYADLKVMSQESCRPFYGNIDKGILCAKSATSNASTCPGKKNSVHLRIIAKSTFDFLGSRTQFFLLQNSI